VRLGDILSLSCSPGSIPNGVFILIRHEGPLIGSLHTDLLHVPRRLQRILLTAGRRLGDKVQLPLTIPATAEVIKREKPAGNYLYARV
jgi:hypothetical protein